MEGGREERKLSTWVGSPGKGKGEDGCQDDWGRSYERGENEGRGNKE